MPKKKLIINDGFNPELANGAEFEGKYDIPKIYPLDHRLDPEVIIPFSERNKASDPRKTFVSFYEHDDKFADIIRNPDSYIEDLARFAGVISPDNSLYRDIPLTCQIANIYRNRLIGSYLQRRGITVIANVRWGDERTYLSDYLGEAVAFSGAPKHSIIAVGCYGCIRGKENLHHFEAGFRSMINNLHPKAVFLYGGLPKNLLEELRKDVSIIQFKDWTSVCHGRGS